MEQSIMQREIEWHTRHVADKWQPEKLDKKELLKYKYCRQWRHNPKQMLFHFMGDLSGKKVLDFGSGQGVSSVEMALLGADVRGFDITPGLVEKSRELARLNGVEGRCRFFVDEATSVDLGEETYDVILVDSVIHHLPRSEFSGVIQKIKKAVRQGGRIIIREPVSLSGIYNKIKSMIPVKQDSTPDERELDQEDINVILKALGKHEIYYFGLFSRAAKYSDRNVIMGIATRLDQVLFKHFPIMRRLAGVVVIVS